MTANKWLRSELLHAAASLFVILAHLVDALAEEDTQWCKARLTLNPASSSAALSSTSGRMCLPPPATDKVWAANATHKYAHMATVACFKRNVFVAWQMAHYREGTNDMRVVIAHARDEGGAWSAPRLAPRAQTAQGASWAPVLYVVDNLNKLLLFWVQSTTCFRDGPPMRWNPGGSIYVSSSEDGEVWSTPTLVLDQGGGWPAVIANPPEIVTTAQGTHRLVLPMWRERPRGHSAASAAAGCSRDAHQHSGDSIAGAMLSDDGGNTWYESPSSMRAPAGVGWLIEGAATSTQSTLAVIHRTRAGVAYLSKSFDAGMTWQQPAQRLDWLPNPDSKLHVLALGGEHYGCHALVANLHAKPSTRGSDRRRRERVGIATSCGADVGSGDDWQLVYQLYGFRGADGTRAHYPTIAAWRDNGLVAVYSHEALDASAAMSSTNGIAARFFVLDHDVSVHPADGGSPQHRTKLPLPRLGARLSGDEPSVTAESKSDEDVLRICPTKLQAGIQIPSPNTGLLASGAPGVSVVASSVHRDCTATKTHGVSAAQTSSAWCAATSPGNTQSPPWIELRFDPPRKLSHLAVYGRADSRRDQRLASFEVLVQSGNIRAGATDCTFKRFVGGVSNAHRLEFVGPASRDSGGAPSLVALAGEQPLRALRVLASRCEGWCSARVDVYE
ncbi:sialidase [Pycnococcus provasolii]